MSKNTKLALCRNKLTNIIGFIVMLDCLLNDNMSIEELIEETGFARSTIRGWLAMVRNRGWVIEGPKAMDERGRATIKTFKFKPGGKNWTSTYANSDKCKAFRARKKALDQQAAIAGVNADYSQYIREMERKLYMDLHELYGTGATA